MKVIKYLTITAQPLIILSFVLTYLRWSGGLELLAVIFLFYVPTIILNSILLFHLKRGFYKDIYMKIFYVSILLIVYFLVIIELLGVLL